MQMLGRLSADVWADLTLVSHDDPAGPSEKFNLISAEGYTHPTFESGLQAFKVVKGNKILSLSDHSEVQHVTARRGLEPVAFLSIDSNLSSCVQNVWKPHFPIVVSMEYHHELKQISSFFLFPDLQSPHWGSMPYSPFGIFRRELHLPDFEE